jgi:hypothetical protein
MSQATGPLGSPRSPSRRHISRASARICSGARRGVDDYVGRIDGRVS